MHFVITRIRKKYTVVNHRDENKLNNRKENLEWVSQKYNLAYSKRRRALGIEKGTIPDKAYGEEGNYYNGKS